MKKWLQLIRLPNLLIVALTQYLLEYFIVLPAFEKINLSPLLNEFHFFLLVLTTIFIAAGGYVINDLKDLKIDRKNKPEKQIIEKSISVKNAQLFYFSLVILGFVIALYLAIYIKKMPLVLMYPIAVLMLWLYSEKFKKGVLIGNIIVSLFCAFVAGIIWFAEREAIEQLVDLLSPNHIHLTTILSIYMTFAFFSTMFREIVKDIEDMEGDLAEGCQTFPIKFGVKKSKWLAGLFGFLLLVVITIFIEYLYFFKKINAIYWCVLFIIFPIIFGFFKLIKAQTKKDFHQLSQIAKLIMLGGIFLLFAIKI